MLLLYKGGHINIRITGLRAPTEKKESCRDFLTISILHFKKLIMSLGRDISVLEQP